MPALDRCGRFSTLFFAAALGAQVAPGDAVIASRRNGQPATQLLAVNTATGSVAALPRFPSDSLPPLAVAFDPIDRELLLVVDAGGGVSRVLRFAMNGGVPGGERRLGDVPGRVAQIDFADDDVLLAVDGAQGGFYRMPRSGGTATLAVALPYLTAMQAFGPAAQHAVAAWSGNAGPPPVDPGLGIVDVTTGAFALGPAAFPGYAHPGITGVLDLPTGVPRQVLSHTDGTVAMHVFFLGPLPTVIAVQPAIPAGGAVAMKPVQPYAVEPLVLGGAAFPYLWSFDPFAAPAARTIVAGPLPGDPVDFALAPGPEANLLFFGSACGASAAGGMSIATSGLPSLGNPSFQVELLQGAPSAPAAFVLGLSDQLGGRLPLRLPNGCSLLVSPDVTALHSTSPLGRASQPLPVPSVGGFIGLPLFAQWLQAPMTPFAASAAVAIHVGI